MTLVEQLNVIRKINVLYIVNKELAHRGPSVVYIGDSDRIAYLKEEISKYVANNNDEEIKNNAEKEIEETINSSKKRREEIESTISKKTAGLKSYENVLLSKKEKIKLLVILGVELFLFLTIVLPLIITIICYNSISVTFIGSVVMIIGLMVAAFFISKIIVNKIFDKKLNQKEASFKKEVKYLEDELISLSDEKIEEKINRIKEKSEEQIKANKEKDQEVERMKNEIEEINNNLDLYAVEAKYFKVENNFFKKCEAQVKKTLENLLSRSLLNKKYYSLECICQILEYLETGRCVELQGKDGCYNLLESEIGTKKIEVLFDEISTDPYLKGQQSSSKKQTEEIKDEILNLNSELNIIKRDYLNNNFELDNFDCSLTDSYQRLVCLHKNLEEVDLCIFFNKMINFNDNDELDRICRQILNIS